MTPTSQAVLFVACIVVGLHSALSAPAPRGLWSTGRGHSRRDAAAFRPEMIRASPIWATVLLLAATAVILARVVMTPPIGRQATALVLGSVVTTLLRLVLTAPFRVVTAVFRPALRRRR
jgi:hypothetical protein